ncbi:MAG TPA: hypothetical protein VJ579_02530 [Candidatus Paceibacterota bacterium]|nr:hypothetical protein [Candidatus Paceibacterota bacterium]
MFLKLALLVCFVLAWLLIVSIKRHIIKSFLNDLVKCEEACREFTQNPLLPVGSVTVMYAMITQARKSFEEGTLPLSALLSKLPAMQQFCAEVEHIASPLLLSHLGNERFVLACNELIASGLPRAINIAKAHMPDQNKAFAHAIENAEQTALDAGDADENELLFTYRRCAIAKAEMDNFAAYL